ncbi:MAG: ThiF family adenylyltransferase [Tepidisphaeraceae bacterium]|jgi:adenylyltransferase/sulfurtransferase
MGANAKNYVRKGKHRRVALVGAGAVGSALGLMVARGGRVDSAVIIDPDVYEARNYQGQNVLPGELGRGKASVLARKMRQINPRMKIQAIRAAVEAVPLGLLRRAHAFLGCLDNRGARRFLNQAAQYLRVDYIDAGVDPSTMLARVNVYRPGRAQPCLQCAWSDEDYRLLDAVFPCQRNGNGHGANNVPLALGNLAASLQSIELEKVLEGRWEEVLVGKQVTLGLLPYRLHVTRFERNPSCRCRHEAWDVSTLKLRDHCTFEDLLTRTHGDSVSVECGSFVRTLACKGCSRRRPVLRLESRLGRRLQICPYCGREMVPIGFDQIQTVSRETLAKREICAPLRDAGILSGDIVAIHTGDDVQRYQLQLGRTLN